MKVVDPHASDDTTLETVVGGGLGEGRHRDQQRSTDTSNDTVNKDSVAEVLEFCSLLASLPQAPQPQRSLLSSSRIPPRRIDHTYRDYSNFSFGELPAGKKPSANFPNKLHQILSSPDHSHVISWMPHGRAWKVHNRELLMSEVLPKYFVPSKYESFTRQLNGWSFKRLHQSGNDFNAYYHECFLREMPHVTVLMKRTAQNQGKLLPHVEGEPNFYEIEKQFPLPVSAAPHPYPGHYNYSSSRMADAGYEVALPEVPEAPYHNQSRHYAPHPYLSSYPPPPPYYTGHHGGPPLTAVDYAPPPHPEYPPSSPYYPTAQGGGELPAHERYHHYPYPPGSPPGGAQSYYDTSALNNATDAKIREEVPLVPPQVLANQECILGKDDVTDSTLELLS